MTNSTQQHEAVHTTIVQIEGMSCGACVSHITNALKGLRGVVNAQVDLERRQAVIDHLAAWTGDEDVVAALNGAGYRARVSETPTGEARTRQPIEPPRVTGCCCR